MSRATEILFIRHGETVWNTERRFQGHLDSPLTRRGEEEARALAEHLRGSSWDALVSSDLGRAMQTASILSASLGLPVVPDVRLRERLAGPLQGRTLTDVAQRLPEALVWLKEGDPEAAIEGAESYRAQYERTVACVESLARTHAGRRLLVVTHGGNFSCIMRRALGLTLSQPRRWSLPNCGTSLFRIEGDEWHLDHWGWTTARRS